MRANNINTFRFLGALFVLIGHTYALCYGPGGGEDLVSEWLKGVTAYQAKLPGIGVAMFFVLSGYLVTRSYDNRHNLLVYVEARALRIFPALWFALLLTVLVLGPLVTSLEVEDYFGARQTWNYLWVNARLYPDVVYRLPGVFMDNPRPGGVNGSLWTLPVEVRMYVIVALLGIAGVLRRRWVFNLVALAMIGYYLLAPDHFYLLYKSNHERLGLYFLLGAVFYINRERVTYHWVGVAVLSLLMVVNFKNQFYNLIYATWFTYGVLYLSFHEKLQLPDLGKYGDFSYGLYLYAFPMAQLGIMLFGPDNPGFIVAMTFCASLALAYLSWHLVEKRALTLKGRLMGGFSRTISARG